VLGGVFFMTKKIEIDLDTLDLFSYTTITQPEWVPTRKLAPYDLKRKAYLDIETTGLDPETCRVIMVGVKQDENIVIFDDSDEKILLRKTIMLFDIVKLDILIGHNLFKFDLPFLIARCNKHGVKHNFKLGDKEKTISASSFQGSPIKFMPVYLSNVEIIDTFQQICVWDKSVSKLTSYNLKSSVLALNLRTEKRLELSNNQIQECYKKGDLETVKIYLIYDLEDTELLGNFLIPIVYYQMKIVPNIRLQELAVVSPALKAQKIHQALIQGDEPTTDTKLAYDGGKVALHKPGIHRNVAKIDVSSLYPSIMLTYGVCSRKDPEHKFLGVLRYMTTERLKLKKLAKDGNQEADHQQNSLKILINGSYGFLGTAGYSFNDFNAAALVTAYGRKILKLMEDFIQNNNGLLIESDTDGVIFSHADPETLVNLLSDELPKGIKVELEFKDCVASVPKAKNYTIITAKGKIINKGAKRIDIPLINEFKIEYLKAYAINEETAQKYYQDLIAELKTGIYPLAKLTITRKIAKSEKKLIEMGFGKAGDIVSFYYGYDSRNSPIEITTGEYNTEYYIKKLNFLMQEMYGLSDKPIDHKEQLSLSF
jgi:DNA polymerase elongation subunit (family B)